MRVFPFFVGSGRSGTTLVRAIFDSHSDMAIPGESHFIVHLAANRGRYGEGELFDTEAFLGDLLAHGRFQLWNLPEPEVRSSFAQDPPTTFSDAVRQAFFLYAESQRKPRYGDKTPDYVAHLPLVSGLFPESQFIHIIRDGRDVALSYLDVSFGPKSLERAALHWRRFVERGRRAGELLGRDRYREIRYEDLLEEPEAVIRSLCRFIDIEFQPEMFEYPARAREVAKGSAFPEAHDRLRLPPTKGLRNWRSQMSRRDLAVFEGLAGGLLSELGYERAVEKPTVRDRAHTAARRMKAETARAAHGVRKRARMALRRP